MTTENLVELLTKEVSERQGRKKLFIVGISGLDASGKSTIAQKLTEKLNDRKVNVLFVSGDYFQFGREYKEDIQEDSLALQHIHRTINFNAMKDDLLSTLESHPQSLSLQIVDYDVGTQRKKTFSLSYPLVVVVESIYLFQPDLLPYFDMNVFLETSFETALSRAYSRPRDIRLYKNASGIREKYTSKNFAGYSLFEKEHQPKSHADIVIDTNDWDNLQIIR